MKKGTRSGQKHITSHQWVIVLCLVALLFVLAFVVAFADAAWNANKNAANPGRVTVTGMTVCLPRKNTDGPQQTSCAIGLKTSDGKYYALHTTRIGMTGMNESIKVTGTISYDPNSEYAIAGTIWADN